MKKKLVLGSGGIYFENESDVILDHIFSLIDVNTENKTMVFLPTGHRDSDEDEEIVNRYCYSHGFKEVKHLYLIDGKLTEEEIRDTIMSASVIYACGGNLKVILETWRKTKADVYLKEAYEKGIVIAGQSSGAMCWCKRGYDNCGIGGRFMFLDGLDLIPYILCPHFEDWPSFLEDVKMQELDGLGVDNDIVISIVDGEYTVVTSGKNPVHTAYYLPADEEYAVHDLMKEHIELKGL